MRSLTVTEIGDAIGIVLSDEMLMRFGLQPGTHLYVVDTPEGMLLTPYGSRTREHLEAGRAFLRDHDLALRALTQ